MRAIQCATGTRRKILNLHPKRYSSAELRNKTTQDAISSPQNEYKEVNEKYYFEKPKEYWDDKNNVKEFLSQMKEKLQINTPKKWNIINKEIISKFGGNLLLAKYSLHEIKYLGFPDGNFTKPAGYWNNIQNIHKFLFELKLKYNLNSPNDWNSITRKQIQDFGGCTILNKYSMYDIKCLGCPEGELKFDKPAKYWENKKNVNKFLSMIKEKLNLKTTQNWNKLTKNQILEFGGGSSLLSKYSLYEIKCLGCPEGELIFKQSIPYKPTGYWDNHENILLFLSQLKNQLHLHTSNDWNLLTRKQILENGGSSLLSKYSLYEIKCLGYPEGKSLFKPPRKTIGFWNDQENIQNFIHKLKEKYNLQTFSDWNSITYNQILSNGGKVLLDKYSVFEIKCLGYPEGKFNFDKPINKKLAGYWNDENNIINFLDTLKEKFNLRTLDDWNRLSCEQLQHYGGSKRFILQKIIESRYPDVFKNNNTTGFKRSSQRWLFLQIQKLFPGEEIVEDYFHSELSRKTGYSVQFDVFLINKNIAFEYHGLQHYIDIPSGFSPLELYKHRDKEKVQLCKEFEIRLLIIPYWWDNKLDSLKATINLELK